MANHLKMSLRSENVLKLQIFLNTDFGFKKYSKKYLKNQIGYNVRYPLTFIKKKNVESIISDLTSMSEARAVMWEESGSKTLRSEVQDFINFKVLNSSYQGDRHEKSLPVRGQRTKTNARTSKARICVLKTILSADDDDVD